MPFPEEESSYPDTFAADVAGEIGDSLFSNTPEVQETPGDGENGEVKPVAAAETPPESKPEGEIVPGQNSQVKPLPKSWKKDMAPLWEKADPALHEYVYAREADMMRGIQQYSQGAQQWGNLIQPFAPLLQQHPDVNPVQLLQGLMNTHLQFLSPDVPVYQKQQMVKNLLRDYGISLDASSAPADGSQPAGPDPALIAELNQLRKTVNDLKAGFTANQQKAYDDGVAAQLKTVEAFATDPKNEFYSEVEDNILHLLQTGAAPDLASAYELAC